MKKMVAVCAIFGALLAGIGCGGYSLEGRGSVLPAHILRVGIPTLENNTNQGGLGEIVTREIYSEFLARGNFQVLSTATGVDALLEGTITSYGLVPRALDEEGVATSFLVIFSADVSFRDLVDDTVLWEQKNYRFSREYQLSDVGGDFVSQELDSIRLAAKDFAGSLVATILTGF